MGVRGFSTRRRFLRGCLAAVAGLGLVPLHGLGAETPTGGPGGGGGAATRPNIVLIMADDMGFSDIGCYGSEVQTPNLDRLAANGMRFTQFYNTARCCPSRASLLTGLYAHQAGVGHMVQNRGTPAYQGFLNDTCVTSAEVLRAAGYRTLMSGKWHVGEQRPHWPVDRGFDRYFGLISGASSYFAPERTIALDDKPIEVPKTGYYTTDAIADHAVEFLGEAQAKHADQPFFLYLPFTAPHWPLHAKPADIAKYRGKYKDGWDKLRATRHKKEIELGLVDAKWPLTERDPKAPAWETLSEQEKDNWDLRMAAYAAQIDCMDQGMGRVLAKIKAIGAEDNTLVFFLADNGGCAENPQRGKPGALPGSPESYMAYGLPWANASNTPFRRYKVEVHEGGISSPLIAYWPGHIKAGTMTSEPAHIIDLMPTCLAAAGAKYPKEFGGKAITPVAGISLLPVLEGKPFQGHDALFWEHQGNRAVRMGRWKIVSARGEPWELYDMAADRTETNDLAAKQPERVKAMATEYDAWAKRCGVVPF